MRFGKLAVATALVLGCGGAAVTSAGGAGAKAAATAAGCGHAAAVCATLAPYGPDSFVLKVYAPRGSSITAFDIWTGKKPTALRPKGICKAHGKASGAQDQLADYAVTRCAEAIKPAHFQTYCYSGGGGIPFLSGTGINAVHIDAGSAGQEDVTMVAKTTKCPAGVGLRKPAKKKR
jgi:hypothetical protein